MRTLKFSVLVLLLLAMSAARANADPILAVSTFTGTITGAPVGNGFGVVVGGFVQGDIQYPFVIGSNFNGTVNNFTIVFEIGSAIYTEVVALGANPGSVTLVDGLITGIDVTYPPDPCSPGGPSCPALSLIGATFFTSQADCQTGQVCGTLNFAGSQPQPTPEPSTIPLFATGLFGLMFCRRKSTAEVAQTSVCEPFRQ